MNVVITYPYISNSIARSAHVIHNNSSFLYKCDPFNERGRIEMQIGRTPTPLSSFSPCLLRSSFPLRLSSLCLIHNVHPVSLNVIAFMDSERRSKISSRVLQKGVRGNMANFSDEKYIRLKKKKKRKKLRRGLCCGLQFLSSLSSNKAYTWNFYQVLQLNQFLRTLYLLGNLGPSQNPLCECNLDWEELNRK